MTEKRNMRAVETARSLRRIDWMETKHFIKCYKYQNACKTSAAVATAASKRGAASIYENI